MLKLEFSSVFHCIKWLIWATKFIWSLNDSTTLKFGIKSTYSCFWHPHLVKLSFVLPARILDYATKPAAFVDPGATQMKTVMPMYEIMP